MESLADSQIERFAKAVSRYGFHERPHAPDMSTYYVTDCWDGYSQYTGHCSWIPIDTIEARSAGQRPSIHNHSSTGNANLLSAP